MAETAPESTLSSYELNCRLLRAAEFMGVQLVRVADSLERITTALEAQTESDPLAKVERMLERAPEALGFDPFTDRNPETFDNRFAGRPIEEQVR